MKAKPLPTLLPLSERKLKLVRPGLAEAAATLLLERGFDAATIDELAAAAGISRRTFFRYFATKEEVVISTFDEVEELLVASFREQPKEVVPLLALRAAIGAVMARYAQQPERTRAMLKLILGSPALRASFLDRQDQWRERLGREIARRLPAEPRRAMVARLTAAVGMGAVDAAMASWAESDASDLGRVTDDAFEALEAVVTAAFRRGPAPSSGPSSRPSSRSGSRRR